MSLDEIVYNLIGKAPIFNVSKNIDEIMQEKKEIIIKLDEAYAKEMISEEFYDYAEKLIEDKYNLQIQKIRTDIEDSNLRFGMSYVKELTGSYPSLYNGLTGILGENSSDAKFKIKYKTDDEINFERNQCLNLLYEQFTSGKISMEELEKREEKINLVYDSIEQSLLNNESKKTR